MKKIPFTFWWAALCLLFLVSCATAAEKNSPDSARSCPAALYANEELFPALLKFIDEARQEIFITMFSFKAGVHQDSYADRIVAALARAAKRGVQVFVLLENTGNPYDDLDIQNKITGKMLASKGIKVFFDSPQKTTHAKMVVIDGKIVIVGSHNFTQSGLKHNNEMSLTLKDVRLARQARDYMQKIIRQSR
ncbi:MAG TPA: phospholipase D-like domain-containing protein [Smithella sp.]|nr:phospholipase D-like domain-containing protein [Smithella sp.]